MQPAMGESSVEQQAQATTRKVSLPGRASPSPKATLQTPQSPASPGRGKRAMPTSPGRTAVVPAATTPPPQRGLVSSLGRLLEALPLPPLKKPRTARWMDEVRGTALMEIPIAAMDTESLDPDADEKSTTRPRRIRMRPLEFWRGEHVVTERIPGSACPSVCAVVLNCAPRAQDLPERKIALSAAVPMLADGQQAEFLGAQTPNLTSKLVVLPSWSGANPPTVTLPADAIGHLLVIEGSLRYALEGEKDMAVLNAGDHLLLEHSDREKLVGVAGTRGASSGAKFRVFLMGGATGGGSFLTPFNDPASRRL